MKYIIFLICTIILALSIGGFCAVIYIRSNEYLEFKDAQLELETQKTKNSAIDECLGKSIVTTTGEGYVREEPVILVYQQCMTNKGYEVNIQE